MSRNYDDDGLCRWCGRPDGEHKASCVLASLPPASDEYPLVDPEMLDRVEDRYWRAMAGEGR